MVIIVFRLAARARDCVQTTVQTEMKVQTFFLTNWKWKIKKTWKKMKNRRLEHSQFQITIIQTVVKCTHTHTHKHVIGVHSNQNIKQSTYTHTHIMNLLYRLENYRITKLKIQWRRSFRKLFDKIIGKQPNDRNLIWPDVSGGGSECWPGRMSASGATHHKRL